LYSFFGIAAAALHALGPHISFPSGGAVNEQIVLRWIHFLSGITWIGLLYYFNLIAFPAMKELEAPARGRAYLAIMPRAMLWFRWSALVAVLVGLRYYSILLSADAQNAGKPSLAAHWLVEWFVVWLAAYVLIYPLQFPAKGIFGNGWVKAIAIAIVVIAASWVVLALNSGVPVSNAHLSIAVGGGIGFLMLLNTWGVVWRVQKRLIEFTRLAVEHGAPMPPDAERLARWGFITSRVGFWMSLPMLFLMGAAEHYPFLSGVGR
jgi:uncharacterized membrane protein